MLSSKDYVIDVFRKEIARKNELIEQLLEKQDLLEEKLVRMEQTLSYQPPAKKPEESSEAVMEKTSVSETPAS